MHSWCITLENKNDMLNINKVELMDDCPSIWKRGYPMNLHGMKTHTHTTLTNMYTTLSDSTDIYVSIL